MRDLTFLVTAFGKPFTDAGLGNWFRQQCDLAGLHGLSADGLRKAAAVIASERGASEKQLNAIFGWQSGKQAAHYTRSADQKRLAASAMHLLAGQTENEIATDASTDAANVAKTAAK